MIWWYYWIETHFYRQLLYGYYVQAEHYCQYLSEVLEGELQW